MDGAIVEWYYALEREYGRHSDPTLSMNLKSFVEPGQWRTTNDSSWCSFAAATASRLFT
jgi:hypothetical protein